MFPDLVGLFILDLEIPKYDGLHLNNFHCEN